MRMTMRWYGPGDAVTLSHIRQVPGVTGIVSALHDLAPGQVWPKERVSALRAEIEAAGLTLDAVESIPVHESIKLGLPERDELINNYCRSVRAVGAAGVGTVCYNFMPVFDWTRTSLRKALLDGSFALAYDDADLDEERFIRDTGTLPGWLAGYTPENVSRVKDSYRAVDAERLWDNLAYFLARVAPAAEEAGVKLAIHPDDPCWPIFGLPRIITNGDALERLARLVDSPANGVTICTGSLGCDPRNDLPAIVRRVGGRIHFVHMRNVRITGRRTFHESAHPSVCGSIDMRAIAQALIEIGFDGPVRPDHGRDIWGERGIPGYGLYDRALGAAYLIGLFEGLRSEQT